MPSTPRGASGAGTLRAELDALCAYLTDTDGPPVHKPSETERTQAARDLDEAAPLSPDQRLLRALLTDDRQTFEGALATRLTEHRETVGDDPRPATLLPLIPIALTVLAVQTHNWNLDVQSPYLPKALLGT